MSLGRPDFARTLILMSSIDMNTAMIFLLTMVDSLPFLVILIILPSSMKESSDL